MTFNVVRKSDGGIVRMFEWLDEAEEYVRTSAGILRIEQDIPTTPRPHPYRQMGLTDVQFTESEIDIHLIHEGAKPAMPQPKVAIKYDEVKPDYSLLPLADLEGLVEVLNYGAKKYTRDNWKQGGGHNPDRLIAACLRHLARYQEGELVDQESGLSHIHHATCNLVFIMRQIRLAKVK